jgi:hypothetical protein
MDRLVQSLDRSLRRSELLLRLLPRCLRLPHSPVVLDGALFELRLRISGR